MSHLSLDNCIEQLADVCRYVQSGFRSMNAPPIYRWFRQGLRNPATRQWVVAGVLIYLISPIDIVPSFLPGVGEIDDLVLVGLMVSELIQIWFFNAGNPPIDEPATANAATGQSPKATNDADKTVVDVDAVAVSDADEVG